MNEFEKAVAFVGAWDSAFKTSNGSVDLLGMSNKMQPEVWRAYVACSRLIRESRRPQQCSK